MNFGDLFDSPWKVLIIAVVVLVLVGSAKLPVFARSLGRSMRILKAEVASLHDDEKPEAAVAPAPAATQAQAAQAPPMLPSHQQQIEQLQQQVRDLQQQQQAASVNGATEAQHSQQST
jgi:sec-independent protein translocase protein TatA